MKDFCFFSVYFGKLGIPAKYFSPNEPKGGGNHLEKDRENEKKRQRKLWQILFLKKGISQTEAEAFSRFQKLGARKKTKTHLK